ncbi:MAG: PDZ domain-containing protein [Candidatus Omnitrophica bacterium]|nr:PDZ domain-containing protein [Candidatus Omnitrophota bacterium]
MNLELKGTVFTKSLKPVAILKDARTGRITMYELGEMIDGKKITVITRGEVVLQDEKEKYILALPGGGVKQPEGLDIKIRKEGENFYITKSDVNKAIAKTPLLLKQVKIVPHFSNGRPEGIRLSKVKEGSVFEKAGVKSGDIVKNVNGMSLNTPFQIFQAYKKLKDEKKFKVEVARGKEPVTLSYTIE